MLLAAKGRSSQVRREDQTGWLIGSAGGALARHGGSEHGGSAPNYVITGTPVGSADPQGLGGYWARLIGKSDLRRTGASETRVAIGLHLTLTTPYQPLSRNFQPVRDGMFKR